MRKVSRKPGEIQQWLKAQSWWEAFKANYEQQNNEDGRVSEYRTMTELLQKSWQEPIASAFFWDRTPEGHEYWANIDKQFLIFYYNE